MRPMVYRISSALLALVLCMALLAGCGASQTASPGSLEGVPDSSVTSGGEVVGAAAEVGAFVEKKVTLGEANAFTAMTRRGDGSLLATGVSWPDYTPLASVSGDGGLTWEEQDVSNIKDLVEGFAGTGSYHTTLLPDGTWWIVYAPYYMREGTGATDSDGNPIENDPDARLEVYKAVPGGQPERVELPFLEEKRDEGMILGGAALQQTPGGKVLAFFYEQELGVQTFCLVLDGATGDEICHLEANVTETDFFYTVIQDEMLYAMDRRQPRLRGFSLETGQEGESLALPEVNEEYLHYAIAPNGDVCNMDKDGIHRVAPGGTLVQDVVEGNSYAYGGPDFYINGLQVVERDAETGDRYVVLGSSYTDSSIYIYEWDPKASTNEADALYLWALEDTLVLRAAISQYKQDHPGRGIRVEYGRQRGETGQTDEDILRAFNTQLLAGEGPDVLILDGLPADTYIEKGLLEDLTGKVPGSDKGYENIMKAYEREGKVYAYPTLFQVPVFVTQEGSPYAAGAATLPELAELASAPGTVHFGGWEDMFETLYTAYSPRMFPEGKSIDEAALEEFIEATARISSSLGLTGEIEYRHGGVSNEGVMPRQSVSAYREGVAPCAIDLMRDSADGRTLFYDHKQAITPLPGGGYIPVCAPAVLKDALHKEDALNFAAMMLTEGLPHSLYLEGGISVLKSVTQTDLTRDSRDGTPSAAKDFDWEGLFASFDTPTIGETVLRQKLYEQCEKMYSGGQSPEEALRATVQNLELYFAERAT